MKIISWNVNGIRAVAKKDFFEKLEKMGADVYCIQETKAQDDQVMEVMKAKPEWNCYINSAERKGYSGTAIFCKEKPLTSGKDINIEEHDQEGRVTYVEYEKFYVVTVYVPNSGSELARLPYREEWDKDFLAFLQALEKNKPVIVCGDLNVAHQEIDLARPKPNYNKSAGYTQKEIDGLTNCINHGFVDTFRMKYPEQVKYSWWSYRGGARAKNVGWRIDYFLVSDQLKDRVEDAFILNEIDGSDHCPVGIVIKS